MNWRWTAPPPVTIVAAIVIAEHAAGHGGRGCHATQRPVAVLVRVPADVEEQDAVCNRRRRGEAVDCATRVTGPEAVRDGHTGKHRRETFARNKGEAPVRGLDRALAVDDAGLRVTALKADRDGLAAEINIPVSIPHEGTVGQLENVATDSRVDCGLNRCEIPRAVGPDEVDVSGS